MKRWGRGEGKCESCNMGVIEDVEHFVMQCPKYEKRRKIFLKDLCCVNKKKLDPHEILILLLSSDIECSAESKLNLFEIANKFLNDIYEARNLVKFTPHNKSYTKAQTIHLSGANDFVKAEH